MLFTVGNLCDRLAGEQFPIFHYTFPFFTRTASVHVHNSQTILCLDRFTEILNKFSIWVLTKAIITLFANSIRGVNFTVGNQFSDCFAFILRQVVNVRTSSASVNVDIVDTVGDARRIREALPSIFLQIELVFTFHTLWFIETGYRAIQEGSD
jgi:hypothetical protein